MPHVLVVDDDDLIRDVLYEFLMEEGYQVSLAQDGNAALAVLEREHGLVVLLDLTMSGLNGEGVLDALQAAQRDDHRIVVITAGRHAALERRWVQQGVVCAVVHKPFTIDHLLALVQQVAREEQRSAACGDLESDGQHEPSTSRRLDPGSPSGNARPSRGPGHA